MGNKKELQLVNFEQAKKLKEMGYDYPTNTFFEDEKSRVSHRSYDYNLFLEGYNVISQPTIQQAFMWLRNEKKLLISINPDLSSTVAFDKFCYRIYNEFELKIKQEHILTYEQAESEALNKALELSPL